VNDFGLEIIIGGVVILLAAIIFLALKISNSKSKTFLAELVDIKVISHDTKIFTFDLPEGTNQIGLNIGEHLELE
jgi:glutamine cyclotransferase